MQFRWIAAITLWTIISGPIFAPPRSAPASLREHSLDAAPTPSRLHPAGDARPIAEQPD